jgi:hypothetical protein
MAAIAVILANKQIIPQYGGTNLIKVIEVIKK